MHSSEEIYVLIYGPGNLHAHGIGPLEASRLRSAIESFARKPFTWGTDNVIVDHVTRVDEGPMLELRIRVDAKHWPNTTARAEQIRDTISQFLNAEFGLQIPAPPDLVPA